MTIEEFESMVYEVCTDLNVVVDESPNRFVTWDDGKSNGFFFDQFTPTGPKLAYAKGQPVENWFPVLVHEYNHLLQWAEKDPIWWNETARKSDVFLWKWLKGEVELPPEEAETYAMNNLRIELDCDRRTVKMAQELELPGDWDLYTKKANSYVMFYHMVLRHRKWYEIGREPYNTPAIYETMPNSLYALDYTTISEEMVRLYETHLEYLRGSA